MWNKTGISNFFKWSSLVLPKRNAKERYRIANDWSVITTTFTNKYILYNYICSGVHVTKSRLCRNWSELPNFNFLANRFNGCVKILILILQPVLLSHSIFWMSTKFLFEVFNIRHIVCMIKNTCLRLTSHFNIN